MKTVTGAGLVIVTFATKLDGSNLFSCLHFEISSDFRVEETSFVRLEDGEFLSETWAAPSRVIDVRRSSLVYHDALIGVRIFKSKIYTL